MADHGERRVAANPFDNPAFREEFKEEMAAILKPVTDKQDDHGKILDRHGDKLADHDKKFNRQAGGFVVLGILGGLVDALAHWKWGK